MPNREYRHTIELQRLKEITINKVAVFKTNVQQKSDAELIISHLQKLLPFSIISFDLEDCDRILRIEGAETYQNKEIIHALALNSFECEELD